MRGPHLPVPNPVLLAIGQLPAAAGPPRSSPAVLALPGGLDLRGIEIGSRFTAIVGGKTADGSLRLLFASGAALLRAPFPLPQGTRVAFRIMAVHPQVRATLEVLPPPAAPAARPSAVGTDAGRPQLPRPAGDAAPAKFPAPGLPAPGAHPAQRPHEPGSPGRSGAAADVSPAAAAQDPRVSLRTDGPWLCVPLSHFPGVPQVRLLVRRAARQDGGSEDPAGGAAGAPERMVATRRFVVELTVPALGQTELDALLPAAGDRLDLVLRSERPLPPALRAVLQQVVRDAGARHGLQTALALGGAPRAAAAAAVTDAGPARGVLV